MPEAGAAVSASDARARGADGARDRRSPPGDGTSEAVLEMKRRACGRRKAGRSVTSGRRHGVVWPTGWCGLAVGPEGGCGAATAQETQRRGGWRGRGVGVRSDAETGRPGGSDARGLDGGGQHPEVRPGDRSNGLCGRPQVGQARIQNRVGGSLVRYCRMSGLLMQPLLAAGPYGVREIRSKSGMRARRPSAISSCRFFPYVRPRLVDRLPLPVPYVLLPTCPGSFSALASLLSLAGQAAVRSR